MSGPSKMPVHLKVLAGTDRKDRDEAGPDDGPQYARVENFPEAPQHLNPDGRDLWNTLGQQLVSCGVLQVVDLSALEQLCYAWQVFRQKAKAGMEITASEHNALTTLWNQFGLTPAARKRVTAAKAAESAAGNRFAGHGKRPTAA